jgi:hypothetical protein
VVPATPVSPAASATASTPFATFRIPTPCFAANSSREITGKKAETDLLLCFVTELSLGRCHYL